MPGRLHACVVGTEIAGVDLAILFPKMAHDAVGFFVGVPCDCVFECDNVAVVDCIDDEGFERHAHRAKLDVLCLAMLVVADGLCGSEVIFGRVRGCRRCCVCRGRFPRDGCFCRGRCSG